MTMLVESFLIHHLLIPFPNTSFTQIIVENLKIYEKKSMFFSKKIKQFKIAQTRDFTGKGRHIPSFPDPSPLYLTFS
jgi:hypothetical protein